MIDPLSAYLRRYVEDAAALKKALDVPLLLVEPKVADDDEDDDHRLQTLSGVMASSPEHGEPLVVPLRKQAANAFKSRITVGRTKNNDIVIDDGSVSRFHAWFERVEAGWVIADAGSKNGTLVNGKKLTPKKQLPVPKDARLRFGSIPASFLLPDAFWNLIRTLPKGEPRR